MAGQRSSYGKRSHSQLDSAENGSRKRRNTSGDGDPFVIDSEDTVYRYLCPVKKIGSVIGRGGEIVKQLRIDTKAKIRICETVPGCDERVITIYSVSNETNAFGDSGDSICPAQDALFKVHDRVVAEELHGDEDLDETHQVTAKLLVPSDQIGCVIGKGGQIIQNLRSETGTQIRILKDERFPLCALSSDEVVLVTGEAAVVKKALYQIASRLHENPSRSQHLLASSVPIVHSAGGSLLGTTAGTRLISIAPFVSPYDSYKANDGDWPRSLYSAPRDESSSKEFSIRIICPTGNIGGVIGKGGAIINQIRQESGAAIKVDSSTSGDDCLIIITTKEFFEDSFSPTIEAAVRLQTRCSEKVERDSGIISFTTRLLVPSSRIGCLIGKGGSIINEMRRLTKSNIRIITDENLPKVASKEEDLVQISGDLDVAKNALIQILTRLRANIFDREGAMSAVVPVLPYVPITVDGSDSVNYDTRDSKRYNRGHSYSSGYGGSGDRPANNNYGSYADSQLSASGAYGAYGVYSFAGRTGGSGLSSQNPVSRRKNHAY